MLEFDAETTRILDESYQSDEVRRRRQASLDVLQPNPGETIIDIGCGNGYLTAELARAVGKNGRIIGVDPSDDMRSAGEIRCKDHDCADFMEGTAAALPLPDAVADKAVSVQVFEYIEDIEGAISEAMRCLKPDGRLVVSDLHFGSFIWRSEDPARMARLRASWEQHFISSDLPERLPGIFRRQGHEVEKVVPVTLVDHVLKPKGFANSMMHLVSRFAIKNKHVDEDVVNAWFDEQLKLAEEGRFFFAITQFVVSARKSG